MSWIVNHNTDGGSAGPIDISPEEEYRRTLDFEIWFYEGVLDSCADYVEVLQALGNAYTARGYYEKGLFIDRKLAKLCPHDPIVCYNLACSYSLMGEVDDAFENLKASIELGYTDVEHMNADPDLKKLRSDDRYEELIHLMLARRDHRA